MLGLGVVGTIIVILLILWLLGVIGGGDVHRDGRGAGRPARSLCSDVLLP